MFYPIYIQEDKVVRIGAPSLPSFHPKARNTHETDGTIAVWPIDEDGNERRWHFGIDSIQEHLPRIEVRKSNTGVIQLYVSALPGRYKTVWTGGEMDAGKYGTTLVKDILGVEFPFPKSLLATKRCLETIVLNRPNALIVDFFAGSGTTGHAVLELNKDGSNRHFIVCTNNENDICEEITYERLKRVMKGYTTSSGEKMAGLGGNLKYLKTDFVPKHVEYGLTDEARIDLTRRANLLLALKENTFTTIETADRYEIFSSPTRMTGVYFTEDKDELDTMLKALKKHAKDRVVSVYIFSWKKGAYKSGFEEYPGFHFEDIPEPILDVYRSIGY